MCIFVELKNGFHECVENKSYYNIKYNGVDRKFNKKGYEIDNVISCCKICNIAKNNNTYYFYVLLLFCIDF